MMIILISHLQSNDKIGSKDICSTEDSYCKSVHVTWMKAENGLKS